MGASAPDLVAVEGVEVADGLGVAVADAVAVAVGAVVGTGVGVAGWTTTETCEPPLHPANVSPAAASPSHASSVTRLARPNCRDIPRVHPGIGGQHRAGQEQVRVRAIGSGYEGKRRWISP